LGADVGDALVGDFEGAADFQVAAADGDQQGAFDAGAVHLFQIGLDRDAFAHVVGHADLGFESVVQAGLAVAHFFGREEVADDIDGARPGGFGHRWFLHAGVRAD
jgi:hypothetical protein